MTPSTINHCPTNDVTIANSMGNQRPTNDKSMRNQCGRGENMMVGKGDQCDNLLVIHVNTPASPLHNIDKPLTNHCNEPMTTQRPNQ